MATGEWINHLLGDNAVEFGELLLGNLLAGSLLLGMVAVNKANADAQSVELSGVTVSAYKSYPVPMMDIDGSSKYVAVTSEHGVEIRRCQHMTWSSANYIACELYEGGKVYNVIVPVLRDAVDIRRPWGFMKPGVYR